MPLRQRLDTTLEAGGCAIVQAFSGADGAFSFADEWASGIVTMTRRVAAAE